MPEHSGSDGSFDEFFAASKTDNNNNDKKPIQNGPTTSTVAALIKSRPVLHHRQTLLETKCKNLF
jgi:hypothetical protein